MPTKLECCKIVSQKTKITFNTSYVLDLSICDNLTIFELKDVRFNKIKWNYKNKIVFLKTNMDLNIVSDIEIPILYYYTYHTYRPNKGMFTKENLIEAINEGNNKLIKIERKTINESFFNEILKIKYKNNNKLLNQKINLYKKEWNNKYGIIQWIIDFPQLPPDLTVEY